MPKKITPKSHAKNKTPFLQYQFLIFFFLTLKKYQENKYAILSFNLIMRIYCNVYNCAIYLK